MLQHVAQYSRYVSTVPPLVAGLFIPTCAAVRARAPSMISLNTSIVRSKAADHTLNFISSEQVWIDMPTQHPPCFFLPTHAGAKVNATINLHFLALDK